MGIYLKITTAAMLLIFALFAVSCSVRPIKSTEEESRVVARCDGHDVRYEQIRFSAVSHKADMAAEYGDDIWESDESAAPYLEELKERVEGDIKSYCTVLSVCKQYNINIDDDEIQKAVQAELEYVVKDVFGGMKKYKESLIESSTTDSVVRFTYGIYYCQNELYLLLTNNLGVISAPTDADELYDVITDEIYRVNYVYLPFTYGGNFKEDNLEKINSIYDKLNSGSIDFSEAIYQAGTDNTLSAGGNHYLNGYAPLELEESVEGLEVGEISEPFELNGAFYIAKREAVDPGYVMSNLYTLKEQYLQIQFNELLSEHKEKTEVRYIEELELHKIK